jgi:DnaJ-class molecular chaperone
MKHRVQFAFINPTAQQARWLEIAAHMTPQEIMKIGETMEMALKTCPECKGSATTPGGYYVTDHGEGNVEQHRDEDEQCHACEGTGTKLDYEEYRHAFALMMGEED